MMSVGPYSDLTIRILCLDGHENRLRRMAEKLSNRGFLVDECVSVEQCLASIESLDYHAVVVDHGILTVEISTALYRKSVSSGNFLVKIILGPPDSGLNVNPLDILATDCLSRDDGDYYIDEIAGIVRAKTVGRVIRASRHGAESSGPDFLESAIHSGLCMWRSDENGVFSYVGPTVEKVLGISAGEIVGWPLTTFINQEGGSAKILRERIQRKECFKNLRVSFMKADGEDIELEISGCLVIGAEGVFKGFSGACREITEQAFNELTWDTTETLFNIFFKSSSIDAIYKSIPPILSESFGFSSASVELYDRESNEMIFVGIHPPVEGPSPMRVPVNSTLSGMVALRGEPLIETEALKRAEYGDEALKKLNTQTLICIPIRTKERVMGVLCLGDHRKRKVSPKLVSSLQIIAGHLAQMIERKTAEEALAKSEERQRTILEQAAEGIFVVDQKARYLEANPAALNLLGWSLDELRKMTIMDVIASDDLEKNPIRFSEIMSGKPVTNTRILRRKDGSRVHAEISAKLMSDGRIMAVVRDITEKLKAEERIADIALFPEQNPFPILRINASGIITYANKSSALVLYAWNSAVGQAAPAEVGANCVSILKSGILHEMEVGSGGRVFSLVFSPFAKGGYVNIYGRDVTYSKNIERILKEERDFTETVMDTVGALVMVVDRKGRILRFNRACESLSGYLFEDIQEKLFLPLLVNNEDANATRDVFTSLMAGKKSAEVENRWITKRGDLRLIKWHFSAIAGPGGEVAFIVATGVDVTDVRKAEKELQLAAKVYESAMDGIMVTDANGVILSVNPAFTSITGYSAREALGKTPSILKSGLHKKEFYKEMWTQLKRRGVWRGDVWNRRKNGQTYPQWMTISGVTDDNGALTQYVSVFQDITEIKKREEEISYHAYHDPLTGLPNRLLFNDRARHAMVISKREGKRLAVVFLDLDGFKAVNDMYGHDVGDMLLRGVAVRLVSSLREEDTVCRLGGDEFIVLLESVGHREGAKSVAEKILLAISEPFIFKGAEISVGASVGLAMFPDDVDGLESLIKGADSAMYIAKEQGKNQIVFFEPPPG